MMDAGRDLMRGQVGRVERYRKRQSLRVGIWSNIRIKRKSLLQDDFSPTGCSTLSIFYSDGFQTSHV